MRDIWSLAVFPLSGSCGQEIVNRIFMDGYMEHQRPAWIEPPG